MIPFAAPSLGRSSSIVGVPDANTLFLARFSTTTPTNEVGGASGTLRGNAFCDTTAGELVLDGTGDYCEWAGAANTFDPTILSAGTYEIHTNLASTEVGGLFSRVAVGTSRYALYASGTSGNLAFYADAFSTGTPVVNANCLDGNWHHIAIVRNSVAPRWAMYVDGVQVSTNTWTSGPATSSIDNFYVGDDIASLSTRDVAGRIARVKLSNVVRYTANFTPPSRTAT